MEDRHGQQLGNYKLLQLVGQGGFADVYLGEHIHLRTQAAIKVLQVRLGDNNIQNFLNEARTIAHLVHPYIVRVLDFGVQDNIPFLVMDYAPNGTFRQRFLQGKPLPATPLVPYIKQTATALQYGHDKKLIHRDVKPENMLLGSNDEVLLGDFGLALIAYNSISRSLTETAGTAAYMAPEQLQGKPRPASDQYALGMIAYEWLTGSCPFQGSFFEIASQQVLAQPPSLQEKAPGTSPEVEKVVLRALEKDPQQRFPNVREFALALEDACLDDKKYSFELSINPNINNSELSMSAHANESTVNHSFIAPSPVSNSMKQPPLTEAPLLTNNKQDRVTQQKSDFTAEKGARSGPPSLAGDQMASMNFPSQPLHTNNVQSEQLSFNNQPSFPIAAFSSEQVPRPKLPPPEQLSFKGAPAFPTGQEQKPLVPPTLSAAFPSGAPAPAKTGSAPFTDFPPIPEQDANASFAGFSTFPAKNDNASFAEFPPLPNQDGNIPFADFPPLITPPPLSPVQSGMQPLKPNTLTPNRAIRLTASQKFQSVTLNRLKAVATPIYKDNQFRPTNMIVIIVVIFIIVGSGIGIFALSNSQKSAHPAGTPTSIASQATTSAQAAQASQTAQAIANQNPYLSTGGGKLTFNDPLTSNKNSWQVGPDATGITAGQCTITDQGYQVDAPSLVPTPCFQTTQSFTNFTYQVDLEFTAIGQSYSGAGIIFRSNSDLKQYYFFEIFNDGNYSVQKCTELSCANNMDGYQLGTSPIPSFKTGINETNTLAVVANGNDLLLYVNNQKVSEITDQISDPYTSGLIGMLATAGNDSGVDTDANVATTAVFSNVKVWES